MYALSLIWGIFYVFVPFQIVLFQLSARALVGKHPDVGIGHPGGKA